MPVGVFADANALYSRTVRDWLFQLRNISKKGIFVVWSSEDIIAEVLYKFRRDHPTADGGQVTRLHDKLVSQLDDRIEDFTIDGSYPGTDPHDQHVHAAAVHSGARIVLTSDKGFTNLTQEQKDNLTYDIYTPDEFFMLIHDSAPTYVLETAQSMRDYWSNKQGSRSIPEQLKAAGCPLFAETVRDLLDDQLSSPRA